MLPQAAIYTALLVGLRPALTAITKDFDPQAYLAHVKYLTASELKGRLTRTPELNRPADYIAAQFARSHLETLGTTYLQDFVVTARTGLSDRDALALNRDGKVKTLKQGRDFIPLNLSANGQAKGTIIFAGYGITAPEYHYDDYTGLNVGGAIVLILRHKPQENNPKRVCRQGSHRACFVLE